MNKAATARRHAVIIGGGIGGLTMARCLKRVGISSTVYEQAPSYRFDLGSGIGLWNNALLVRDYITFAMAASSSLTHMILYYESYNFISLLFCRLCASWDWKISCLPKAK